MGCQGNEHWLKKVNCKMTINDGGTCAPDLFIHNFFEKNTWLKDKHDLALDINIIQLVISGT